MTNKEIEQLAREYCKSNLEDYKRALSGHEEISEAYDREREQLFIAGFNAAKNLPQAAVSGALPLPHLCPACDGECKEHLEPVYKCTVCSGIFSGNDR